MQLCLLCAQIVPCSLAQRSRLDGRGPWSRLLTASPDNTHFQAGMWEDRTEAFCVTALHHETTFSEINKQQIKMLYSKICK